MATTRDVLENVREDDFVEYFLFPSGTVSMAELKCQIEELAYKEIKDYIWQKDEFKIIIRNTADLPPVFDNEEQLPPHFYGVTHFGENIEDEWFIVHILIQLTKAIPGLTARIVDVDGEFLLIEAADALPKWANPEVCDKRVYIENGEVHIIPVTKDKKSMTVIDALKWIRMSPELTRACDRIQTAIENRVTGYPDKVQELFHQTIAFVPAGVAALLKEKPSLIAPAITAFCYRDPIDVRACRAMRYFPPETRVMGQIKMTRCLYAMLLHHKYNPDRRTGWNLPPANAPDHLAHSIGVKLACGFEILVSQCKNKEGTEDLENDKGWHRYKQSLTDKGYFRELLEGCVEYKRLEQEAKDYYQSHAQYSQKPIGQTVLDLLNSLEVDIEGMKKAEGSLPPPDDDSWMEISSDDLDKILTERYGAPGKASVNDISSHLNSFLDHVSGLEGAEHPKFFKDEVPLRPKRHGKKNKSNENSRDDENNRISLDQEAFSCAVQNILDFSVPEDSWDLESEGSGMSSYEDEIEMDLSRKKTGRSEDESSEEKSEMKQYMDQMDRELSTTTLAHSFHKKQPKGMEDSFSDIESFEPVDIDMNALKNILESYQSQMGGAGPATNMLGPMGIRLEKE